MRLSKAVQEFIADKKAAGKAKGTTDGYQSDLNGLIGMSGHDTVLNLSPDIIKRFFRNLSEDNLKLSTLHRKSCCVREFIRWGARERLWSPDDLLAAVPHIRRQEPMPRPFSRDESARIWKLELPLDERTLRAILFFSGLRASTICGILVGNVSEHPPAIEAVTKGGKTIRKPMHPKLAELVFNLILTRTDLKPQSYLFVKRTGKPLRRRDLERITHEWGTKAKVTTCLPHRFRHTFATEQLAANVNLRVIQKSLDHADIKSTTVYTKVNDDQISEGISRLPESWGS